MYALCACSFGFFEQKCFLSMAPRHVYLMIGRVMYLKTSFPLGPFLMMPSRNSNHGQIMGALRAEGKRQVDFDCATPTFDHDWWNDGLVSNLVRFTGPEEGERDVTPTFRFFCLWSSAWPFLQPEERRVCLQAVWGRSRLGPLCPCFCSLFGGPFGTAQGNFTVFATPINRSCDSGGVSGRLSAVCSTLSFGVWGTFDLSKHT